MAGESTGTRTTTREAIDLRVLAENGPVHFMGVGGAGMSALAEFILRSGGSVTGCDLRLGAVSAALEGLGATIAEGHDPSHVANAVAVVATSAVPADHPELVAARARGIPVLKRAEALGSLVNRGRVIAIAGTHGKTTTTALTTSVLAEAGLDPTGFVGGHVQGWVGGLRVGTDDLFVVEADEYDRSFLTLRPSAAVVTAVDADHLDIYGSLEAIESAFREFLAPVPEDGLIAACVDDPGARRLLSGLTVRPVVGYGIGEDAELRAVEVEAAGSGSRFVVEERGERLFEVELRVPGLHNVRNALAAVAIACWVGADPEAIERGLRGFGGVARRFERIGEARGVVVVDDYAHHPTEVAATIAAARGAHPDRRLVVAFQPHLYTRTRDFSGEFGEALVGADLVALTDVYPAREAPIPGVTGELVVDAARAAGAGEVLYLPTIDELVDRLTEILREGDLLVTMGAGDITTAGRRVLARLSGEG